jgi:hypothetical protein
VKLTESHGRLEIWTAELDHDGIGVSVDDLGVVLVAVLDVVVGLDFLR